MPRRGSLPRTKRVRSKGHDYLYFKTKRLNENGRPIYAKLPAMDDPSFGTVYASLMAGASRKVSAVMTVPDLIDLYKESPNFGKLAASTQRFYSIYLGALASELPTAPAARIERTDVARLVDKWSKKPGAANGILKATGALYRWGRDRGHVENNPTKEIRLLDVGEHQPWDEDIVNAALAAPEENIRLSVAMLYYTGQRIGDVSKMRWTDVRNDAIRIVQEKTGTPVVIPIHERLAEILAATPRRGFTIISLEDGRGVLAHTIRTWIKAWVHDRFNLPIVPHGLRKNAVNALLEKGCGIGEVSAITGHSLKEVEHYAKRRNKEKLARSAMQKWDGTEREWANKGKTVTENGL